MPSGSSSDGYLIDQNPSPEEWDRFVRSSADGTLFHTSTWRGALEGLSMRPRYLAVRKPGEGIVAVFPLFYVAKYGLFRVLASVPESDLGGPLLRDPTDIRAIVLLKEFLTRLPATERVAFTRAVLTDPRILEAFGPGVENIPIKSGCFVVDLKTSPPEKIWGQVFEKKTRQKVHRLESMGASERVGGTIEDLREFYRLYRTNLKSRGRQVRDFRFFHALWEKMYPDHMNVLSVSLNGSTVAFNVFFLYPERGTVHLAYMGYDHERVGNLSISLYCDWKTICWARSNGYSSVNFGTTAESPANKYHQYKALFGGEFVPRYLVRFPANRLLWTGYRAFRRARRTIRKRVV